MTRNAALNRGSVCSVLLSKRRGLRLAPTRPDPTLGTLEGRKTVWAGGVRVCDALHVEVNRGSDSRHERWHVYRSYSLEMCVQDYYFRCVLP